MVEKIYSPYDREAKRETGRDQGSTIPFEDILFPLI
jgi:hypothetical protein